MAACSASPASSVDLAPKRSASMPPPIRPAIDASPDTPNAVAATMGPIP